jgi:hypothetical protein
MSNGQQHQSRLRRRLEDASSAGATPVTVDTASSGGGASEVVELADLRWQMEMLVSQVVELTAATSAQVTEPANSTGREQLALTLAGGSLGQIDPANYLWQDEPYRPLTARESSRLPSLIAE